MNAVEIEEAVAELAQQPFEPEEFPFALLAAFDNKATTIKRLRQTGKNSTNRSDVPGGVLQRNNIHIATCQTDQVGATLDKLRNSPATAQARAQFILATDGQTLEAENLSSGETVTPEYSRLDKVFGFFLLLADISTVREIERPGHARGQLRRHNQHLQHRPRQTSKPHPRTTLGQTQRNQPSHTFILGNDFINGRVLEIEGSMRL